jgi:hypothetical protein
LHAMNRQFIPLSDQKYEFVAGKGNQALKSRPLTYVFARMGLPPLIDV